MPVVIGLFGLFYVSLYVPLVFYPPYEQQLASGDASSNPIDHLSPEELAIARRKVLEKLRQQRKRSLMKLVLIGAVLLSLATWLLAWVFGY